jgi:acetyl esterase/lipase
MGARISKALEISTFLSWSLALIPLLTCSSPGRGSEARVERRTSSPPKTQNQTLTESGPQTPDDAQVNAVLDKMAAAGITRPTTVADVRKAYLFYPKLSGTPEHVFHIDDRKIIGPAGNVTVRIYTPNPTRGLPILVFFHGGGFVAGNLDTHDNPLRSVTNRCECIVW